jgi:hypothetical protein
MRHTLAMLAAVGLDDHFRGVQRFIESFDTLDDAAALA